MPMKKITHTDNDDIFDLDMRKNLLDSIKAHRKAGNKAKEAVGLCMLADIERREGEYKKSIKNYRKSLKIQREIGDEKGQADSLYAISTVEMAR